MQLDLLDVLHYIKQLYQSMITRSKILQENKYDSSVHKKCNKALDKLYLIKYELISIFVRWHDKFRNKFSRYTDSARKEIRTLPNVS